MRIDVNLEPLSEAYFKANPEAQQFWEATQKEQFLIKHCGSCEKSFWYPKSVCPTCGSQQTEWQLASGQGILYSYSVLEKTEQPYVMAYIQLAEGPIVFSQLKVDTGQNLQIGAPVQVAFQEVNDSYQLPYFTLV